MLRCIARHVFNNPLLRFIVRYPLLNHMSQHMHAIIPVSGGNTVHQAIATGINEEYMKISGSPQTHYHSVDHYRQLMADPSTYATHTEIVAANQLYNIQIPITFAGEPYPTVPGANTCGVLYSNEHYSTLQFNSPSSSKVIVHFAYYPLCPQATPRFPHHCTCKLHLRNSYSSIFDACPPVLHEGNCLS